ncbi:histidine ammonia-lyase [Anaerosphaera aminiphila DSM 21120]|uniref:Histidine ammonia-lyase n=1 Tax=Anaerosphaera aminiphila DSM 21120 TaxID=1120995 RepID=A0A1M5TA07_9FIRM|nr:histidine ammonia-lyase [Anaerosphaera aminiphila]SHH47615.1 histidine ammonia-lyase [Anaerosphaera aminiphila DSM 21120]
MNKVVLTGNDLTLEDLVAVAREHAVVEIADSAVAAIEASRQIVDNIIAEERVVYGVTTGFGSLCEVSISNEDSSQLQENLIRTHSTGYGNPLAEDEVRATMLIRINSLVKGYSGIRLSVVNTLLDMLNKNVIPHIPEKGSLGASGDLAPLAHMVLPMLGLGRAYYNGELMSGKDAMAKAGIEVITLAAKEGLALINGTTVLTGIGALATHDAIELLKLADIAGALSMEAHRGIIDAFYEKLHLIRPHKGCLATAKNIRELLDGSTYITHTAQLRVQDAYSLRCMPQIHGANKDSIAYVKEKVEIEINAGTDNPIITPDGDVISGGNFHGEPMAQPFDLLGIGAAEIGNVSERRIERLVNAQLSDFPSFLVKHPGLNSGFMITQYAAAALVSENKVLAHPASVDSIPSCENQEDFVSMATIAARKARDIIGNSRRVVATEIMAACQAIDFREDEGRKLGVGTQAAYDVVRENLKFIENDKDIEMYDELEKMTELLVDGTIVDAVEKKVSFDIQ